MVNLWEKAHSLKLDNLQLESEITETNAKESENNGQTQEIEKETGEAKEPMDIDQAKNGGEKTDVKDNCDSDELPKGYSV